MVCFSVVVLCYGITRLWFCNKGVYDKKGCYLCHTMYLLRGTPKTPEFIKNCVLILTFLTSVTFKVLSIWCNTPTETFFHCSKQFLYSLILMPFSASTIFCFASSTSVKRFPLRTFSSGETKKVARGWDQVSREVGHRGHAVFGQKLLNTQHNVGRCACKSPIMMWENALKESLKEIHWSQTQPLTTTPAGMLHYESL